MAAQILIVDDDPVQRRLLDAHMRRMGHRPVVVDGGRSALEALRGEAGRDVAVVVLDLMMPEVSGLAVLAELGRRGLGVPVVVQTARGGTEIVVEAMRAGAFDFVVKPASHEKLRATIEQAIKFGEAGRRLRARTTVRTSEAGRLRRPGSAAMRTVLQAAERAAGSRIPIFIEGETGVGKEWLAEAIRASGPRSAAPFVTVNCGALPSHLVESILFGHEKGAFTDATERRSGRFLEADGGTLFLDEVGELPQDVQVKLLRVLQRGEVDPVGARTPVQADVRVISATNRNLSNDVDAGRFRQDLFYRLNVFPIRVPPLRERREEIAPLCDRFLSRFCAIETGGPARRFSAAARELLSAYDWPGNIRQLENVVHRAVVLAESATLEVSDFPQLTPFVAQHLHETGTDRTSLPAVSCPTPTSDVIVPVSDRASDPNETGPHLAAFDASGDVVSIETVEAELIRLALGRYNGRMSEVARRLGIGRSTLYRKLRLYGIAWTGAEDDPEGTADVGPDALRPQGPFTTG